MLINGIGTSKLFYLFLIIIGSSGLGLGVHSASAACGDAPAPGVNYNGCDLTGQSFIGDNLRGATFVGATIDNADFTNAQLQTADFTGIDTQSGSNTDFIGANLTRATFVNANEGEGTLSFQGADLHYADFSGTDLSFSEMTSQADITGVNFSNAILQNTDFTQSIMKYVIFSSGTYLKNAIFNGVDLSSTYLAHLDLSDNNFNGANFLGANLTGTSLANSDLEDAQIGNTIVTTNFNNADLSYVDFTGATMSTNTSFVGAITIGSTLLCTGNPICITSNNPPPVIQFDKITFTGDGSIVQINSTAWKISASGSSGTNIQYTGVYATVGTNTIQQGQYLICTPNAVLFPIGINQVTCTATDPTNPSNTSTSHFYIIVADNIPPTITTPSPITVQATGPSGAVVTYTTTATDNVDGTIMPTCTPSSGSTFILGTTTVNCKVTDSAGNTQTASFTITVQDTTPPTITPSSNPLYVEATGPSGAIVSYHVTAFDLVDGKVTPICTPINGTQFALGNTIVTCTATDSHHNTSTPQSFTVTVRDTTSPKITAPGPITTAATGTLTQVTLGTPTVSDTVDPNPTVTNNAPAAGFPIGETDVTWTATDHSGNSATAIQKITITSTVTVTITAPSDITVQATAHLTPVALGTPTFTDPLDPNPTITNNAPAAGYPVGNTVVTWNLKDKYGNTATSAQIVTVQDTTPPTITPSSNPLYVQATGPSGAIVSYHVTAFDLVDGKVTPICTPINGTQFALGNTIVTCTATDSHHNTSTPQSFTVTVQDTTGPVITLPTNPLIIEAVNQNGSPVTYHVTANDIVTGNATNTVSCTPPSGSVFGLGNTVVTCTAHDAQNPPNTSAVSFTVTVHDTTPPTITAPPSITATATGTLTQVTLGTPTVHDTVDPNPTVTNNAPAAGYPVGTTIVTWTATDHAGNSKTATQTVTILPKNTPGKVNGAGSIGKGIKFDMNVQSKDGLTFKGHLDYNDELVKIDLDSQSITGLYVDSTSTKANFTGTATLNGKSGYTFTAYVIDKGNPGKNDFFQITIFDSTGHKVYTNSGKLTTGNLHVNQKCDVNDNPNDHDLRDKWNNNNGSSSSPGQGNNDNGSHDSKGPWNDHGHDSRGH